MKQVLRTFITLLVCSAILHAQVGTLSDVPLFLGSSDSDPYYQSVVVPLNSQNGVKLDRLGNNQFSETVPWFHRIQKTSRKYITVTGDRVNYDVEVENPIVAFGSLVGGSPLHVNQEYRFLISVGAKLEAADSVQQAEVVISAYSKNSFLGNRNQIPPEHRFSLTIPKRGTPQWTQFVANGSLLEISDPVTGLDASLAFDESSNEEENPKTPYLFTLRATNADYYFTVEAQGTCKVGNRWHPVTKKIHGHDPPPREILFCLNFESSPAALGGSRALRKERSFFGSIRDFFLELFGRAKKTKFIDWLSDTITYTAQLNTELNMVREENARRKTSIWRKNYEIEKAKEKYEWENDPQYKENAPSRQPRLDRIKRLEEEAARKEAEFAEQLEREFRTIEREAQQESYLPWFENYKKKKVEEEKKWPIYWEHHDLPRGSSLQEVEEYRRNAERIYNEQKQVKGIGQPSSHNNMSESPPLGKVLRDPVNAVTGEFYVNAADITLNGPMPLTIGRNYSSQSVEDATDFGYGWKISCFPYLLTSRDRTVIHAADLNGSVIAYIQDPNSVNRWIPTIRANAHLNNTNGETLGSVGNMLNAYIEKQEQGSGTTYILQSPAGDKRTFKVRQFQTNGGNNEKICLEKWEDNNGNYYSFHYGSNANEHNYGRLSQIISSNGESARLSYDPSGHIIQISSGEGENARNIHYRYSQRGDLIEVKPTAGIGINYEYDSSHHLTHERKPDGRILQNVYDSEGKGQVIEQKATMGDNSVPERNATFKYYNHSPEGARAITGFTVVTDVKGNKTYYEYQRSLITKITDPLGGKIEQQWYTFLDEGPGAYFRSLKQSKDQRGLLTYYKYDSRGNLIEKHVEGNLTGNQGNESATTRFSYNSRNLQTSIVDPLGNEMVIAYEDTAYPWLPTRIDRKVQGTVTSSTQNTYYQVTADGKFAKGLLQKIKQATGTADEAITEYTHDARGFLTSTRKATGTGGPEALKRFSYNSLGQLTEEIDSSGAITRYSYDPVGNCSKWERLDEKGILLSSTNIKYNKNREPDQIENSHEDTIRYQYDYAGRLKEEQLSKSQQSDPYNRITYRHDLFGNLTEIIKNGHSIKMGHDQIGQMLTREEGGKETEEFSYDKGGEIATYKNALGGVTEKQYTSEGKLCWQKNPDGSTQQWRYQLDGRLAKEILSNGSYWETAYNDIERKITRTLKDSSGQALVNESYHFDHRGNLISYTDAEGYTFRKTYDKLNRLKSEIGPPASPQAEQRTTFIAYDDKKRTITISNALGEKSILSRDPIGRTISMVIQDASGQKVRENTYAYSANEVTENNGSLTIKILMESLNHSLTHADGTRQQISYRPTDRSLTSINEMGERTVFHYDPFERLIKTTRPDGKEIRYVSNLAQKQYELLLPRGLSWKVTYSKAGQQLTEKLTGEAAYEERKNNDPAGSLTTCERVRSYYESGPNSGKLMTTRDARGLGHTLTYDNMGRVAQVTSTGSVNGTRKFTYDRRGLVTSIAQTSNQSEPVHIARAYSPYGDLIEETITLNGQLHQKITQKWDKAGRRIERSFGNFQQNFSYRADGQLIRTRLPNHNRTMEYTYGLDGLLKGKTHANMKQVMSHDNRGRLINRTTQINNEPYLEEKLTWRANSTIGEYQAQYPRTWLHKRSFQYGSRGELISETYPKKPDEDGRISYQSPYKTEKDLGVRIGGYLYFVKWLDKWGRPKHIITDDGELRTAYHGDASPNTRIRIKINGVVFNGAETAVELTASARYVERWLLTEVILTPGDYLLSTEAYDPNTMGIVRANDVRPFSVGVQPRIFEYEYDPEGNRTKKVVRGTLPNGTPTVLRYIRYPQIRDRVMALKYVGNDKTAEYEWDAWGRLVKVVQRDKDRYLLGYQWTATYDSLGRRLKTVYTPTQNGIPENEKSQTITSYYDPEVEFLEIGVSINNGPPIWKAYGVDKDGTYGGLQGIGGLEAIITPTTSYSVINDALGHTVAVNDGSQTKRVPIQVGAYGPLPGSMKVHLSPDYGLEEVTNWLGRRMDMTGLYYMGSRYYDPVLGQFISADPLGQFGSFDLYSYAHNDPVNYCDPDGRFGKQVANVGIANASTGLIPVSMGLGSAGIAAGKMGFPNVARGLNTASANTLEFVADRWTAGNQGPMGRVVDRQIHATTSLLRPAIGQHNQQFLADWLTGNSPNDIVYDPGSVQVRDMQNSPGAAGMQDTFYLNNARSQERLTYGTGRAYVETILNPKTANWKSTAMQVGGFGGATVTNNNDGTATYTIPNTAGANSFLLHVVPNIRRTSGPMSNVRQTFRWTEPINPSLLPKN